MEAINLTIRHIFYFIGKVHCKNYNKELLWYLIRFTAESDFHICITIRSIESRIQVEERGRIWEKLYS